MDGIPEDVLLPPGSRLFDVEEANALLPELERELAEMDSVAARGREVRELMEDLDAYYGDDVLEPDNPEGETYRKHQRELRALTSQFHRLADKVSGMGALLKDPRTGVVDFYHVRGGELVLLCWQRGERRITHYHELDGGYAGRRALTGSLGR